MKKLTYHRGLLVTVVLISAFVSMLNQTVLSVAQPAIMQAFNVTVSTATWLSTGYSLIGGILIPITAWLADRFNTKRLVVVSLGIFLAGTIVSFLSGDFATLLTGRLVQAVGAGVLSGLSMTILFSVYDRSEAGKPTMLLGIIFGLAPAIGPTLAGYIVDTIGWHWIFGLTLPIIALALLLAVFFMADVVPHIGTKLDALSVLLSTVGFGCLLYGVSETSDYGWINVHSSLPALFGGLVVAAWVWRQLVIDNPMLELRIFKVQNFSVASVISAIAQISMVAVEFILPLYMQNARDMTALQSGLTLLPGALVMFLLAPLSGSLVEKNKGRQTIIFGVMVMTISTLALSFMTLTTPIWSVMALYALRNVGLTFAMMPSGTMAMNALPKKFVSHGSAGNNVTRQVGAAFGTAALISVMQSVATSYSPATSALKLNAAKYARDMHLALIHGAQAALWLATLVGVLGIGAALLLNNSDTPTEKATDNLA
ncbi:DHA2 family efflux MFS transporter permease subunit [Lactiplantibacillus garii]|uniref:DHA2 family efflux MFS transporter permease subunit n=1 Tax=Lactiplantibacillus garii TaxID=2306423 RepID=A0A3R8J7E4_9LACO|nr:DHA2 family efflux MFS transporter permease subunit [Lactiplantibacillus garii]RRK10710.1 DHA2 family efflux MFS transporter permease subunit [Lactiplantibacillus garii]